MNKTVFITGATSGFGKAIAEVFAQQGYHLCITGRRKERLASFAQELTSNYGIQVHQLCFDVRNKHEVIEAIATLSKSISAVDILINNAGLAAGLAPIDEGDTDDWDVMIDTNVKGLLYVTRHILPLLKQSKAGHIINIGSTAGKLVYKNGNVYCATKFAVDALTQSMRIDLLADSIKVTAINPGMAETEFALVRFKGDEEKAKALYNDIQPLRAENVANVVFYCATLPAHVCINDLTLTCTGQANGIYTMRDSEKTKKQ